MSTDRNDGGSAFPFKGEQWTEHGMTLRDWLAGMVMQGLYAGRPQMALIHPIADAELAYSIADAMIAARAKVQS
jgi:hypothetical protein